MSCKCHKHLLYITLIIITLECETHLTSPALQFSMHSFLRRAKSAAVYINIYQLAMLGLEGSFLLLKEPTGAPWLRIWGFLHPHIMCDSSSQHSSPSCPALSASGAGQSRIGVWCPQACCCHYCLPASPLVADWRDFSCCKTKEWCNVTGKLNIIFVWYF